MTTPQPPPLRRRATSDLIVMCLTFVVGFAIVVTLIGGIVWKILDPDADVSDLTARVGDLVNTLIGAIVGYLAGRGARPGDGYLPPKEP